MCVPNTEVVDDRGDTHTHPSKTVNDEADRSRWEYIYIFHCLEMEQNQTVMLFEFFYGFPSTMHIAGDATTFITTTMVTHTHTHIRWAW